MQVSLFRGIWTIPHLSDATLSPGVNHWRSLMKSLIKKLPNPLLLFATMFLVGGMALSLVSIAVSL